MTTSVSGKGRVLLQNDEGKMVANLDGEEAIKLGLELLDAGKKAAENAGQMGDE